MKSLLRMSMLILAVTIVTIGCDSTKHRSVRTYEHDEAPPPERRTDGGESGEYEMESPGEMVVE